MRICIFCHDHKFSGANMSLYDWLSDSRNSENDYIVVLPRRNNELIEKFSSIGVTVMYSFYKPVHKKLYKKSIAEKIKLPLIMLYAILFNNISYYFLYRELKKMNVDIIHSNSFATVAGVKVAVKLSLPHIWHIREFMEEDHQIKHFFENSITKYCTYSSAIFISDVIADKYRRKYNFRNSIIIYNKIKYDKNYVKLRKFMEDGCCNIIIVGTLSENKGQLDAIKAVEKLNRDNVNYKLLICGTGVYEDELKKYVKLNNVKNVSFLGHVSNVTKLRKKIDVALMCSKNEALGRVSIEAQYYENLLIGANCGFTPYVIEDGKTGFLYDESVDDLYSKILYSINNKSECTDIIERAKKESLSKYNVSVINKIEEFYKKEVLFIK